jgi:hypothetical protein
MFDQVDTFATTFITPLISRLLMLALTSLPVHAQTVGKASTIIFPTRIILDDGEKSSKVNLVNRGTARGAYRLSMQDSGMSEGGNVSMLEEGVDSPFSIKNFIRFSPRRTELGERDNQNIRIQIRPPKDLPDGEYFGHLKVLVTSDNVEADRQAIKDEEEGKGFQLKIKQRSALAIPVIYRHGKTSVSVELTDVSLDKKSKTLSIDMLRKGNASIMGDLLVDYIAADGSKIRISEHMGKAIYVNIDKRAFNEPLKAPKDFDLNQINLTEGQLHIRYVEHDDQSQLITETFYTL